MSAKFFFELCYANAWSRCSHPPANHAVAVMIVCSTLLFATAARDAGFMALPL